MVKRIIHIVSLVFLLVFLFKVTFIDSTIIDVNEITELADLDDSNEENEEELANEDFNILQSYSFSFMSTFQYLKFNTAMLIIAEKGGYSSIYDTPPDFLS